MVRVRSVRAPATAQTVAGAVVRSPSSCASRHWRHCPRITGCTSPFWSDARWARTRRVAAAGSWTDDGYRGRSRARGGCAQRGCAPRAACAGVASRRVRAGRTSDQVARAVGTLEIDQDGLSRRLLASGSMTIDPPWRDPHGSKVRPERGGSDDGREPVKRDPSSAAKSIDVQGSTRAEGDAGRAGLEAVEQLLLPRRELLLRDGA